MRKLYVGKLDNWKEHVASVPVEELTWRTKDELVFKNGESHFFIDVNNSNLESKLIGTRYGHVVLMDTVSMIWLKNNLYLLAPGMFDLER